MKYLVRTPLWMKRIYPRRVWNIPEDEKVLYLTFDDGPHPRATAFVLDELKKIGAKATFFCIGDNVDRYPELFHRIRDEGHATGNHTQHHMNGWKTDDHVYLEDVREAHERIGSSLFRPPYGRLRFSQAKRIPEVLKNEKARIIMWDVLSGDFDPGLSGNDCLLNVTTHAKEGSIIVFHDSEKAWERLSFALPRMLEYFAERGYRFFHL